jgi:hypothetical protein
MSPVTGARLRNASARPHSGISVGTIEGLWRIPSGGETLPHMRRARRATCRAQRTVRITRIGRKHLPNNDLRRRPLDQGRAASYPALPAWPRVAGGLNDWRPTVAK